MRTSQSENPRCAWPREEAELEDAPTRRVPSGDARSRHMLLNDITLWHVGVYTCGGQSYVTLGSTRVVTKVRPKSVGVNTCSLQS